MAKKRQPSSKKTKNTPIVSELLSSNITPEERMQMISEAAYYKAQQRGFDPQGCEKDWFEAEALVDGMLSRAMEETHEV
jgi:hypothetical protein